MSQAPFFADGVSSMSLLENGSIVEISFKNSAGETVKIHLTREMSWGVFGSMQQLCEAAEVAKESANAPKQGWREQLVRSTENITVIDLFGPSTAELRGGICFDRGTLFQLLYSLGVPQMRSLAEALLRAASDLESRKNAAKN